jgi:monovalent cation:H+ antiporter-2, CPA2 family
MDSTTHDLSRVLIKLGLVVIGLAILARIASRWGFSAIPLYLLAGLAFGNGGLAPLKVSAGFIQIGAEIGALLLLFMLGVEYTGRELVDNLRGGFPAAVVDLVLNFTPGLIAGLLLRWQLLVAILLGGVTYVSSSGVIAKVLADLRRLETPETLAVLAILVLEDLAMAVYLPLVAVLLAGGGSPKIALSVSLAIATVFVVLVVAVRYGQPLSRFVVHESDEIVLLTTFGAFLLVAGVSQRLQVSAAIGAFLVGIAVSGPMAHKHIGPLPRFVTRLPRRSFFLWASDRPRNPALGAVSRRLLGCHRGRYKAADGLLGSSTKRSGPARTPTGGDGPGGTWRVFDCDCRLGCWS